MVPETLISGRIPWARWNDSQSVMTSPPLRANGRAGAAAAQPPSPVRPRSCVRAQGLPDLDLPWRPQQLRQRRMPFRPVWPPELNLDHVVVALPGLAEHEAVCRLRVAVQHGLMEHRLVAHRVEHAPD